MPLLWASASGPKPTVDKGLRELSTQPPPHLDGPGTEDSIFFTGERVLRET